MTPYPEYKATNLPWLPQIPAHWEISRAKNLYYKAARPVLDNAEVVTCFRDGQVTLRKNRRTSGFTESLKEIGYQGIAKGDLVIHVMDAFAGAVGVSDSDGKGTPVYSVCVAKDKGINNYYYAFIVREMAKRGFIQALYRGIRERSSDFRFEVFAAQSLPVPPAAEQEQIVRYLDSMTAKINKLIRAKKKQIALLQEQKQAIINQAVTKGLNPNAEMKYSGIDWLGSIPAHWDVKPLKRVCKVNASVSHLLREFSDDSLVTFLPMEAISVDGKIDCSQKQPLKNVKSGFSSFAVNDVVVAKITPCFENGKGACLDALDTAIGYGTTELIVLRGFKNEINQQFLYQVTKITSFRKNGAEVMTGSAGQIRVPANFIANFTCGIPPLEEQNAIVQYLAKQNALFEKTLNGIKKEIEVILEYKNSLIASVVTGQVDVRNIQVEEFDPADLISEPDGDPAEEESTEESEVE